MQLKVKQVKERNTKAANKRGKKTITNGLARIKQIFYSIKNHTNQNKNINIFCSFIKREEKIK